LSINSFLGLINFLKSKGKSPWSSAGALFSKKLTMSILLL